MFSDGAQRLLEEMLKSSAFLGGGGGGCCCGAPTLVSTGSLPRRTIRLEPGNTAEHTRNRGGLEQVDSQGTPSMTCMFTYMSAQ